MVLDEETNSLFFTKNQVQLYVINLVTLQTFHVQDLKKFGAVATLYKTDDGLLLVDGSGSLFWHF
jgi:hypothetical protein